MSVCACVFVCLSQLHVGLVTAPWIRLDSLESVHVYVFMCILNWTKRILDEYEKGGFFSCRLFDSPRWKFRRNSKSLCLVSSILSMWWKWWKWGEVLCACLEKRSIALGSVLFYAQFNVIILVHCTTNAVLCIHLKQKNCIWIDTLPSEAW